MLLTQCIESAVEGRSSARQSGSQSAPPGCAGSQRILPRVRTGYPTSEPPSDTSDKEAIFIVTSKKGNRPQVGGIVRSIIETQCREANIFFSGQHPRGEIVNSDMSEFSAPITRKCILAALEGPFHHKQKFRRLEESGNRHLRRMGTLVFVGLAKPKKGKLGQIRSKTARRHHGGKNRRFIRGDPRESPPANRSSPDLPN